MRRARRDSITNLRHELMWCSLYIRYTYYPIALRDATPGGAGVHSSFDAARRARVRMLTRMTSTS